MPIETLASIAFYGCVLVLALALIVQCRRPRWFVGRAYLWIMNRTHSGLTAWGLKHVSIGRKDSVLDVGCGGGRTMQSVARLAQEGTVHGVDHSAASVAAAGGLNRDLIAAGRGSVQVCSVSKLPFPDAAFDVVTAVETHYYWPDPVEDFKEVRRVLKPGGRFVIIAEVYRRGKRDYLNPLVMRMLGGACPGVAELEGQLASAGFSAVQAFEERGKGWLASVAVR